MRFFHKAQQEFWMGWEGISPSAPEWTGRDLNSRVQPFSAELPATSTMPTWRSYQTDLPALSHTKHENKTFKHYASGFNFSSYVFLFLLAHLLIVVLGLVLAGLMRCLGWQGFDFQGVL
jgi:hypothetical protein